MLGAIIGDIIGSRFEFNNHRSKDFELFSEGCSVTDDSIMTLAVAKAIMEAEDSLIEKTKGVRSDKEYLRKLSDLAVGSMQGIGREYPGCGYGGRFLQWVFSDDPRPYNSFGNGAAMRISPVGFAARTKKEAIVMSRAMTSVSHDHEEGIKGAEATAVAIFMARQGIPMEHIRRTINDDYYPIDFTIDGIRPTYRFNETCQETVPQALQCFLESESFEDAIRTAVSLGGDSDTIAAITGALAEAYHGVPQKISDRALTYLDHSLRTMYDEWSAFMREDGKRFEPLIGFITELSSADSYGEWVRDERTDRSLENPLHMPFIDYSDSVIRFVKRFHEFIENHPEYELCFYMQIMKDNSTKLLEKADVKTLDAQCVLALIMTAIRGDRYFEGFLLTAFRDGSILKWLKRIQDIERWTVGAAQPEKMSSPGYNLETIISAVDSSLAEIKHAFSKTPHLFFTENDILMGLYAILIRKLPMTSVPDADGNPVNLVHTEYPTPFRCDMNGKGFRVSSDEEVTPKGGRYKRGHYDLVILNPNVIERFRYKDVRGQDYKSLEQNLLPHVSEEIPVLLYGIEINFFRSALRSRRGVENAAALVKQDHDKLQATSGRSGFMLEFASLAFFAPGSWDDRKITRSDIMDVFKLEISDMKTVDLIFPGTK